jgi:hypothetical protein
MKRENGFATVFSIFMSLLLFSFCGIFVIVASFLGVKHNANHAAEEAALSAASNLDCIKANQISLSNNSELITCEINKDSIYVETFAKFRLDQIEVFNKLGIYEDGVTGSAKAK